MKKNINIETTKFTRFALRIGFVLTICFASTPAQAEAPKYLYGLIDQQGHTILAPKFEYVERFMVNGHIRVKQNGKWGIVSSSGKTILKPVYEGIRPVRNKDWIATVKLDGKWGLVDQSRKLVIKPKYDKPFQIVTDTGQGRIVLNGKHGIIDNQNRFVIKPRYEELGRFRKNGLARIKLNGLYGFIDKTGKTVVKPQYQALQSVQKDSATLFAKRDGRWGLIDLNNMILIDFKYEKIAYCNNNCGPSGFALVTVDGKMGIIDRNDKFVIKPRYEGLGYFDKTFNLAMVNVNGKFGFIGLDGKTVIEPKYFMRWPYAFNANTGLARVALVDDNEAVVGKITIVGRRPSYDWGLINTKGQLVVKPIYERIKIFNPRASLYEVWRDGKTGIIDRTGKFVLKPGYVYIGTRNRHTGYSMVRVARTKKSNPRSYTVIVDGDRVTMVRRGSSRVKYGHSKEGLVDNTGKLLLKPKYERVRAYEKDRTLVRQGDKWGLITFDGRFIIKPEYDRLSASYSNPGVLEAELHGKHGLMDDQGNNIIEPKFDERVFFYKDVDRAKAKLNGKWGMIDRRGKMVIPPKYESIEGLAFSHGSKLAPVKLHGEWGLIDSQDNMVIAPKYTRIERLNNNYFRTSISLDASAYFQSRPEVERRKIIRSIEKERKPAHSEW